MRVVSPISFIFFGISKQFLTPCPLEGVIGRRFVFMIVSIRDDELLPQEVVQTGECFWYRFIASNYFLSPNTPSGGPGSRFSLTNSTLNYRNPEG